jgi:isopentenyl diphosphate isomerase/L-lactate dehydrogenase-like FMN-dependent dehydrogenase
MSAMNELDTVTRLADFEPLARQRMQPAEFDYVAGGADDELTLAENEAAFSRLRLSPRVLVDVSKVDPRATLLGQATALPGRCPSGRGLLPLDDVQSLARRSGRGGG